MLLLGIAQRLFAFCLGVTSRISPRLEASEVARRVLAKYPLIDQHIDLPVVYRIVYGDDVSNVNYGGNLRQHVDLRRLREGGTGGFFSIAFVPCYKTDEEELSKNANDVFTRPNNMVRDTLEQIDVTKQLAAQYSDDVALAISPEDVRANFQHGKISHLIGIEGAHSLGNSLAALRMYYDLGVRYLTLTHTCHNPFADTSGSSEGQTAQPLHGGLSRLGGRLIDEMNRIGMMIDVSHTSDDTARQAIGMSKAPVFFSHSGARSVFNHTRNVPDEILELISEKKGKHDSFIGVPFVPFFIGEEPTLDLVADHIEHIAKAAGKSRVGIGSDFDGFAESPIVGVEDVSKYHNLLETLARRGWEEDELAGLTGGNFLRVFAKVQSVAEDLADKGVKADTRAWSGRPDLKGNFSWFFQAK